MYAGMGILPGYERNGQEIAGPSLLEAIPSDVSTWGRKPAIEDRTGDGYEIRAANGSRLSCGALKKDSFLNQTRAASFKRLLGGQASRSGIGAGNSERL